MRLTRRGKTVVTALIMLVVLGNEIMAGASAAAPTAKFQQAPISFEKRQALLQATWTPEAAKAIAKRRLSLYGWAQAEFKCLEQMWTKESNWRWMAQNKQHVYQVRDGKRVRLYAGGIPQILGLDAKTTPMPEQIRKGLDYIESRYDTPCRAWRFWQSNNYY